MVESEVFLSEEISLIKAEEQLKSNLVAAIVLETIQGEGGDYHFRTEYFEALRKSAYDYVILSTDQGLSYQQNLSL